MSDPFRDDREAQLARAEALERENEELKRERDLLKEQLAAHSAMDAVRDGLSKSKASLEAAFGPRARTQVQITFGIRADLSRHAAAARVVKLDGRVVKIGRVSSAHLRIDEPSVARMHAVIEASTADEAVIIDLGTPDGTFVNGLRVRKGKIKSGDVIRIGEIEIDLLIEEKPL